MHFLEGCKTLRHVLQRDYSCEQEDDAGSGRSSNTEEDGLGNKIQQHADKLRSRAARALQAGVELPKGKTSDQEGDGGSENRDMLDAVGQQDECDGGKQSSAAEVGHEAVNVMP